MKTTRRLPVPMWVALALSFLLPPAQAAQITGSISFAGDYRPVDSGGAVQGDLTLADKIYFGPDATFNPPIGTTFVTQSSGDFASVSPFSLVTMSSPLEINPAGVPVGAFWSVGGFSLTVSAISQDAVAANILHLSGYGTITGAGYDPTPGVWLATFNNAAGTFSWSMSSAAVPCTGQIGDFVWQDNNGNGCQDTGEPGIPGVKVDLYSGCGANKGALLQTTTTDADGKYLFTGLCAGDYTVSFTTPNGFTRTVANNACSTANQPPGTQPGDLDSDCSYNCAPSLDCGICVTLPTDNSQNLTIDCGYVNNNPCLELTKTADSTTAAPGAQMGYTYAITNCGGTTYNNLAIIDDAGTPGFTGDDFTVVSGLTLLPGQGASYHVFVYLPIPECAGTGGTPPDAGTLFTQVLPNGDVKVTFRQSRNLNDNVYGTNAPADGWASGHTFGNLTGSDKAEFRFTDGNGKVVLDFYSDYVSATTSNAMFPSGYRSLGPNGGDGSMITGAASNVVFYTSTLAESLNHTPPFPSKYTVNSPTPEGAFPTWDYVDGYTVVVSSNAFGAAGFGGVTIPYVHNSPAKTGNNQVSPTPCAGCITNIASAVTANGGVITAVLATDDAIVCTGGTNSTPPCLITPGTLKIDKKTVQLPIKNNGTVDVFLSEVDLSWNQAVNGNLVKMSLNGDFWVGSASSPIALASGFNADPNRRKIAHGQTKTLVLTFANDASKTVSDYSGTIKFGSDASCAVAFPPATQPAAFSCDGHLEEIQMKWTGAGTVDVKAWYGGIGATGNGFPKTFTGIAPGSVLTVNGYSASPNDVVWEIFQTGTTTKIGNSDFHLSCSDADMNGSEDCGKAEGDGKGLSGTWVQTWQLVGMTTKNGTKLTCP